MKVWREFKTREVREAKAHAAAGGIAVHHSGFFYRGRPTAHLLAEDRAALLEAAEAVGCDLKWIQDPARSRRVSVLHFDLFGGPLYRALQRCRQGELAAEASA